MRSLSISRKIAIGFSLVVVTTIGLAAVAWLSLRDIDDALRSLVRTTTNASAVEELSATLRTDVGRIGDLAVAADAASGDEARSLLARDRAAIEELAGKLKHPERQRLLKEASTAFGEYAAAIGKIIDLSRKYDTLRPNFQKVAPVFEPAISAITKFRVARNDAGGTAEAAEIMGVIGEGRRMVTAITNAAGPALSPETAKLLPQQVADAKKIWADIEARVKTARSHASEPAEQAEFERLAPAVASYAETLTAILPVLVERAEERLGRAAPSAQRTAEHLKALVASSLRSQEEVAQGTLATSDRATTTSLIVAAIGIILAIGIAVLIIRAIVPAVIALTRSMQRLAEGDTSIDVPATARGDEVGAMARTVQVFKDNALKMAEMTREQEQAKARAEAEKKRTMAALADGFEASVRGVVGVVSAAATEMQATAQSMTTTAEQTRSQSLTVASASQEASANVQTVATAAEELSSSIGEISRQVTEASRIASRAAEEGKRTDAAVQGLAEAAGRIGEVVQLINEIASQTNLLALNATIEAARAGEAGKGFAVVASEVKTLANQTARATDDIRTQIAAIQGETQRAVEAIRAICATIVDVNDISTSIASAVEEQGAATQEIARNVQEAARGTEDVSKNIDGVTAAAGETGAAASQVLSSAGELARQSEMLKGEVDRFLASVRAA